MSRYDPAEHAAKLKQQEEIREKHRVKSFGEVIGDPQPEHIDLGKFFSAMGRGLKPRVPLKHGAGQADYVAGALREDELRKAGYSEEKIARIMGGEEVEEEGFADLSPEDKDAFRQRRAARRKTGFWGETSIDKRMAESGASQEKEAQKKQEGMGERLQAWGKEIGTFVGGARDDNTTPLMLQGNQPSYPYQIRKRIGLIPKGWEGGEDERAAAAEEEKKTTLRKGFGAALRTGLETLTGEARQANVRTLRDEMVGQGLTTEDEFNRAGRDMLRGINEDRERERESAAGGLRRDDFASEGGYDAAVKERDDPATRLGSGSSLRKTPRELESFSGAMNRASRRMYGGEAQKMRGMAEAQRLNEGSRIRTPKRIAQEEAERVEQRDLIARGKDAARRTEDFLDKRERKREKREKREKRGQESNIKQSPKNRYGSRL